MKNVRKIGPQPAVCPQSQQQWSLAGEISVCHWSLTERGRPAYMYSTNSHQRGYILLCTHAGSRQAGTLMIQQERRSSKMIPGVISYLTTANQVLVFWSSSGQDCGCLLLMHQSSPA